jgi:hypothetical protein
MSPREGQSDRPENRSLLDLGPAAFAAGAKERLENLTSAQTELLDLFRTTNQQWLDRMQAEAKLASEFASKLAAARSVPDAMAVCQEWSSRRFAMLAEDAKHVLDDTQKFMQTAAHVLTGGFAAKGL